MPLQKTQRLEGGRRIRGDLHAARPLVSIIMVLFRDREECVRLLNNIFTFDPCEFELLVFDGGSDDGTADVLREWDDKIDYWLSEPDSGIYDAMNKGVAAATGEYVFHLNAGDTLKSIPSETLAACLKDQVDVASFAVEQDRGGTFFPKIGFPLKIGNTWHHQGTFYRRTPHIAYDITYKIYADFDLNQRLFKSGKKVKLFDQVVSVHGTGGVSHSGLDEHENYRAVQKNFGGHYVVVRCLWLQYQTLRRGTKRVIVYLLSLIGKSWPERK